jgi:hypothetical protein
MFSYLSSPLRCINTYSLITREICHVLHSRTQIISSYFNFMRPLNPVGSSYVHLPSSSSQCWLPRISRTPVCGLFFARAFQYACAYPYTVVLYSHIQSWSHKVCIGNAPWPRYSFSKSHFPRSQLRFPGCRLRLPSISSCFCCTFSQLKFGSNTS